MYCTLLYHYKDTHATEADLEAVEMFLIQRRTESAAGRTETSGSESQTGWRELQPQDKTTTTSISAKNVIISE